jgi:hypothetical protein
MGISMKFSCQNILCPFGIIRGIILLVIAYLLSYPVQQFIFFAESRFEAFLFLAIFIDIFSRAILFIEMDKQNKKDVASSESSSLKTVRALFSSNYGGQFIAPLWFCCIIIILFNRAGIV